MPPLYICVQVARRQLAEICDRPTQQDYLGLRDGKASLRRQIDFIVTAIFGDKSVALDHDPALILRPYNPRIKDVAARYAPHAHDPDALIYRERADHQQKTTGRKPGALRTVTTKGSDIGLKAKFNRLEGRTKRRPKRKIPGRPFPKGRKFRKP